MFKEYRATAHQALTVLETIADPRQAVKVLGYTEAALGASVKAQRHLKNVNEALAIIGRTEADDRFPAPGLRARVGAQTKIAKADQFAKSLGL